MKRLKLAFALLIVAQWASLWLHTATAAEPRDLLRRSQKIVFLGDSITFGGHYVACFEAWLLTQDLEQTPVVIDAGLPSETVSGLSEEGHAGGKFPRPDLAERLDRVLALTKPDLVFACYGINCGIYQPLDDQRLQRYQQGIRHLKRRVEEAQATFVVITPPFYDDQRAKSPFSYNAVLDHYGRWLLAQREQGWLVVDLHGPMTDAVDRHRQNDPDFTFQPDAVHPNAEGHWFMARQLIHWFGDQAAAGAESPEAMLAAKGISPDVMKKVQERMTILRDAYVAAAGHQRPGVRGGLPVADAEQRAQELTNHIVRDVQVR